jgi:uncharacterized small protein (DUF1192 family)
VRLPLVIALLALTGCSLFRKPTDEALPKQPDAPTKPDVVQSLGKDLDKTDHRVASALVAIERNADKPKVVVAESRLAQSYLPQPPEQDVQFAVARAAKGDPVDYAKQMEFGRKLATAVNKAWEKLEAQQAEALRVSQLKDARIADLQKEIERVKKDASAQTWTLVGAGLAAIGALTTAFLGPRIGLPLLLCGAFCGAVPFIIDSPWFEYAAGATLVISCGLGLWWLADRVRDSINKSDKPDDEQA